MVENATPKSARKASEKDPVTSIEAGEVRELTNADIEASYINNGKVLEESIERIGMGRYQLQLFCTCGFGFAVDQILLISVTVVMPQIQKELSAQYQTLVTVALYVGLLIGAIICGTLSDIMGRRFLWQASLCGTAICTLICASSPNFASLCVFVAFMAVCGGGNLAIDLTVFIEALPKTHTYLMTALAATWGVGTAIGALIAWPLIANYSCPQGSTPVTCHRSENMGWRYQYITVGGICLVMAIVRIFIFRMEESPIWLASQGELAKAVASINRIATTNRSDHRLSVDRLAPVAKMQEGKPRFQFDLRRFTGLFKGRKQARSMVCLVVLWMTMGIAYPIYSLFLTYYLQAHGAKLGDGSTYQTYRDYSISATAGIFGPILSAYLIEIPWLGRRRAMTLTALIAGAFAGAFTSVRSEASNLAFSCMVSFWQNAFYAILYAYTPEVMRTEHRGTGCGLTLACGRLASVSAPLIATFSDVTSATPIWVCCGLYVAIGGSSLFLPFEPGDQ